MTQNFSHLDPTSLPKKSAQKEEVALQKLQKISSELFLQIKQLSPKNPSFEESKTIEESNQLLQELENLAEYLETQASIPEDASATLSKEAITIDATTDTHLPENSVFDSFETNPFLKKISLEERYQRLRQLGEGGMGVVEAVRDQWLERDVALKRIKMKNSGTKPEKNFSYKLFRLKREAILMAHLEHPNIVPVYEMEQNEVGELHFTMRKVSGKTLKDLLLEARQQGKIDAEEKFLGIFQKICEAVAYAHSKGIIHRDLKPENVMVGDFGEVYVMDWGIAKQINETEILKNNDRSLSSNSSTQSSTQKAHQTIGGMGTFGYMPPEQHEDASLVTSQADIFALGKMLRECFTYLSPIEEMQFHVQNILRKKYKKKKISRLFFPTIPRDIEAIVKKATDLDLKKRYRTVLELLKDVECYRKHLCISARDYTFVELLQKWSKRYRKPFFLMLAFFGVLGSFTLYFQYTRLLSERYRLEEALKNAQAQVLQSEQYAKKDIQKQKQELLKALSHLNLALSLDSNYLLAEEEKIKIGKQLIQLACQTQDYSLAEYLASELSYLPRLGTDIREKLLQEVDQQKNKKLNEHLARFNHWEQTFRRFGQLEGDWDNALFEISQMQENEIFQHLCQILEEGTTFFLEEHSRDPKSQEFYILMATALGQQRKAEAIEPISLAIEQLSSALLAQPIALRPTDKMRYLIVLINTLAPLKATDWLPKLRKLRIAFGEKNVLGIQTSQTIHILTKILSEDPSAEEREDYFISLGEIAFAENKYVEAIRFYSQAIQKDPKDYSSYNNRGLAFFELKRYTDALSDFDTVVQDQPWNADAYSNRGMVKKTLGDISGAIEDYTSAIRIQPKNPNLHIIYMNRGSLWATQDEFALALQDYQMSLKIDPLSDLTYCNLGILYLQKDDFEKAHSAFENALKLNPKNFEVYLHLGTIKFNQKDFYGALKEYNEAIRYNPSYAEAYYKRARVQDALEDFTNALVDYTEAIRLAPEYVYPYQFRGILYSQLKQWEKALADYNKAIELAPENAELYFCRGVLFQTQQQISKAIENASVAVSLNPKKVDFWKFRAGLYENEHLYQEALEDWNQIIFLEEEEPSNYYFRANLFRLLNQKKEAIVDLKQMLQYTPDNLQARYNLAMLWLDLFEYTEAEKELSIILEKDPQNDGVYLARCFTRIYLENWNGIEDDFKQACLLKPANELAVTPELTQRIFNKAAELGRKKDFEKGLSCVLLLKKYIKAGTELYEKTERMHDFFEKEKNTPK